LEFNNEAVSLTASFIQFSLFAALAANLAKDQALLLAPGGVANTRLWLSLAPSSVGFCGVLPHFVGHITGFWAGIGLSATLLCSSTSWPDFDCVSEADKTANIH